MKKEVELLILISGFVGTINQTMHSRFSYTCDKVIPNARFEPAFGIAQKGKVVINLKDLTKGDLYIFAHGLCNFYCTCGRNFDGSF